MSGQYFVERPETQAHGRPWQVVRVDDGKVLRGYLHRKDAEAQARWLNESRPGSVRVEQRRARAANETKPNSVRVETRGAR